jgi:hypothetical protein
MCLEPSLCVLAGYVLSGASLKYLDIIGSMKRYQSRSITLSILAGLLFAQLASQDQYASTMILSIFAGALFARKVDTVSFKIGLVVFITAFAYFGQYNILFTPFLVLAFAALLDELGNDRADKDDSPNSLTLIFRYRPLMKSAIILMTLISTIPFVYALYFISFDFGYHIVERLSGTL